MGPISSLSLLACPQCTYDNVMPMWYWFAGLRLGVVVLIAWGRLDIVRTLGLFALYEAAYFIVWRFLIALVYRSGPEETIGLIGLLVVSSGIPAIGTLWSAAQTPYFRRNPEQPLSFKRCLILLPAFLALNLVQNAA